MKKLLTIITFCITIMTVNAQAISGIVVDETGMPIESVNVVLNTTDSVFIEGTATNKSGEFILQKGDDSIKRLIFSHTSYQTKTISITHGNIDTIVMLSNVHSLSEAVVIASNTIFKDGKRIITPTAEQIAKSPTGLFLLDKLILPRLIVDIDKNSVSAIGGNVVTLINGREADNYEIVALDAKNIISVEYSDIPLARFAGASIIINFIVKQIEKGGTFTTDLTNGLVTVYGEDYFFTKFYNGASQFSMSYWPQFRDFKSQWRENEETFYINGTTIQRKEQGENDRFRYLVNNLSFRYNYFKNNRIFDVSLTNRIENYPDNNYKSKLFTNTSNDTLFMTDNSQNTAFTPNLRLYYQEPLGKHQMLYATLSGGYAKRNYKRDYKEMLNDNTVENYFYSDVDENQQVYNASVSYENDIKLEKSGWTMTFDAALKHNYSTTKNNYNNTIKNTSTKIDVNRSELSASLTFTKDKSYINVSTSLYRNANAIGDIKNTYYNLYVGLSGQYTFSKTSSIWSDFMLSHNRSPSLSDLSNVDQFIDSIQIRRGNPNLSNPKYYQNRTSFDFETKNLYLSFEIKYEYMAKPVMETSFLEGKYIIRTVENHKSFHEISPYLYLNATKLWNFLSVQFCTGIRRNLSYGNTYTHAITYFFLWSKVSFMYKKWQLSYSFYQNSNDSFWGETLDRSEGGDRITLYYIHPKFYVGIGCFDPFTASTLSSATINHSEVAPYRRYQHISAFRGGKGFFVRFGKTLRWGQQ
ncbi:MAG: carboxypeptidase-like regulatory domain-containing protein, partial [Prevotellaceae bacterium]|nr:carboxypeptidase-like regulatory domain-containing protein [Prevotellaceae bacterium]